MVVNPDLSVKYFTFYSAASSMRIPAASLMTISGYCKPRESLQVPSQKRLMKLSIFPIRMFVALAYVSLHTTLSPESDTIGRNIVAHQRVRAYNRILSNANSILAGLSPKPRSVQGIPVLPLKPDREKRHLGDRP
jgi:hypothetical protein